MDVGPGMEAGKRKRKRIVVDVSNLSIHAKKFIRTGIQEVVYKTLMALARLRNEFPEAELVLLPQLPRRFGNLITGSTVVPYQNPPAFILQTIEKELGLPSQEVWGLDLQGRNYNLSDDEAFQILASADAIHIQSLVNIGPLTENLRRVGAKGVSHFSMTVYDLVPVLFPEYCDHGLARWFQGTYLKAIGESVTQAVCISRNTALDLLQNPITQKIPHIGVLPLPFDLGIKNKRTVSTGVLSRLKLNSQKHDSEGHDSKGNDSQGYLIFLGSLEPRKNFDALLAGYETYRRLVPDSTLQLVIVGATGWKNDLLEKKMRLSPVKKDLIRAGYLSDEELDDLIDESLAMVMVSHYEGYGLPVAQAFSKGVPVITTLGSSLPEACGGDAIFVDPHDPFSVCAGIQQVVLRKTNPVRHRPESLGQWTWENYGRQLLKLMV